MKLAPVGMVTISAEPVDEAETFWAGTVLVGKEVAFRSKRTFPDEQDAQEHVAAMYRRALGRALTGEESALPCEHIHSIYLSDTA